MSQRKRKSPATARKILQASMPAFLNPSAIGDYEEIFHRMCRNSGRFRANLWYWSQMIKVFPKFLWYGLNKKLSMFLSYIRIGFRNLLRHKGFSFINISGLSIGMVCCILILLYVQNELSYDRHFSDAEHIYRLAVETEITAGRRLHYPNVGGAMAGQLKLDFPELVSVTRVLKTQFGNTTNWFVLDNVRHQEDELLLADSTLFDVFDFAFISGDPRTALVDPFSVVLTEKTAKRYFGNEEALNKTLGYELFTGQVVDLKITGVLADLPGTTHMHFDILAPMQLLYTIYPQFADPLLASWSVNSHYTYFKTRDNFDVNRFHEQLPEFLKSHTTEQDRVFLKRLYTQKLTDIHLYSTNLLNEIEQNGNMEYVLIFAAIAVLTLFIACINFMNLSTAKSANRAREVGVRKVFGAHRKSLFHQFALESILITVLALALAVIVSSALLPVFNEITGKELQLNLFENKALLSGLILIALFVSIVVGSYPALFLSAFKPAEVLKGKLKPGAKNSILRKTLVVGQFSISIILITCALIVSNQVEFIRNKDLGFIRGQVAVIPLNLPASDSGLYQNMVKRLKKEFADNANVQSISIASSVPGDLRFIANYRNAAKPGDDFRTVAQLIVDYAYMETMQISLAEGRNFSPEYLTDSSSAVIINEAAAERFGLRAPYVGKQLELQPFPGVPVSTDIISTVIGVINNINFEPLRRPTEPMVLILQPHGYGSLMVKIDRESISQTMNFLESKWKEIISDRPFVFSFLDENLDRIYRTEENLSRAVKYLTFIAIFIACLGLFGLASFTAEQRTKEIGIRKVLGATAHKIVILLTKEFVRLVIIANLFAWPTAYYFASHWLQSFAFHVDIDIMSFLISGVLAVLIALVTVSYQALKAAIMSPSKTLKYE